MTGLDVNSIIMATAVVVVLVNVTGNMMEEDKDDEDIVKAGIQVRTKEATYAMATILE
jgi:hypothetical protein